MSQRSQEKDSSIRVVGYPSGSQWEYISSTNGDFSKESPKKTRQNKRALNSDNRNNYEEGDLK